MSEDRYIKNRKSVHKICDVLGYRLVSFDPNWTIVRCTGKMPSNPLVIMSYQMSGKYDTVDDELMGRLALLMGFTWEFHETDENLKLLIKNYNGATKDTENRMNILISEAEKNKDEDTDAKVDNIQEEALRFVEEVKDKYNHLINMCKSEIKTRENIRKWEKEKEACG